MTAKTLRLGDQECSVVRLDAMFVDECVQRAKIGKHVDSMVNGFDKNAVKPFAVSYRDKGKNKGRYSILDGQQEWHVLQAKGYDKWFAMVYRGLTIAQECLLLNKLNHHKTVQPRLKFRNELVGGNSDAIELNRVITSHGFQFGLDRKGRPNRGENVIKGVAQMQKIQTNYGLEYLDGALKLIKEVFSLDDVGTVDRVAKKDFFIRGVALFLSECDIAVDDAIAYLQENGQDASSYWIEAKTRHGNDRRGVEMHLLPQFMAVCKAKRRKVA